MATNSETRIGGPGHLMCFVTGQAGQARLLRSGTKEFHITCRSRCLFDPQASVVTPVTLFFLTLRLWRTFFIYVS